MLLDRLLIRPSRVKQASERVVLSAGGAICDWLPVLDVSKPRTADAVARRALVLNALVQVGFRAPTDAVSSWLSANHLDTGLSPIERQILQTPTASLSDQDRVNLTWRMEALWALMWAGNKVASLDHATPAGDGLARMFPSIQSNESPRAFVAGFRLRPYREMFAMLDLQYRMHWYARDGRVAGYSTGLFEEGVIQERRWALAWVVDSEENWDEVDLGT